MIDTIGIILPIRAAKIMDLIETYNILRHYFSFFKKICLT